MNQPIWAVRGSASRSVIILAMLFAGPSCAVAAGPEVGKDVPKLSAAVLGADGSYEDSDLAAKAQDKCVVYLLVNMAKWDRPIARFLKTLDMKLPEYAATPELVAVWVTTDVEQTKEYLPKARQSLQFERTTMAAFADDGNGPADWNVGNDASLTVVVTNQGKTAETFEFVSTNETDVPTVGEAIQKALTK
jgi:hypothetical protein